MAVEILALAARVENARVLQLREIGGFDEQFGAGIICGFVGEGRHRREIEELAQDLGLSDRVVFTGAAQVGAQIRENLDQADLFIAPSRSDGLPRALLEAMARGLPCIASDVGGIPEVLALEALSPAGDVNSLSEKISEVASDPCKLSRFSRQNLETSRQFQFAALLDRREQFYRFLLDKSQEWRATC